MRPVDAEQSGKTKPKRRRAGRLRRFLKTVLSNGRGLALLILLAIVAARVEDPSLFKTMRHQLFDLYQQTHPRTLKSDRVVIVDIDEASIRELGQWPWSRDQIARLVDALNASGAVAIGFDMVFSEPDRLSPDAYSRAASNLPPIVRGVLSELPSTDSVLARSVASAPVSLGMSATIEPLRRDRPAPPKTPVVEFRGDPRPFLFGFPGLLRNIAPLEATAPGIGLFTLTPEHDGVVRRVPSMLRVDGAVYPSLTMEMLRIAAGASTHGVVLNNHGTGVEQVRVKNARIPTDENARVWLHFAHHEPSLYLSAADVIEGRLPMQAIDGKFVLIGTSAVGLRDLRVTALHETVPGVEVHAQLIDTVLSGDYYVRPNYALNFEHLVAILSAAALILVGPMLSSAGSLLLCALLLGGIGGGAYYAFLEHSLAIDAAYPALLVTLVFAAIAYGAYSRAEAQKRQIRSAFRQYLSPALVERLADNPESLRLGGESREMTFLFCDIAGFTSFVEQAKPEDLVMLLNEYLDGVCRIVMESGGTIDKIVGDAVHAMFNAPLDDPEHAANAVACAQKIEDFVRAFRDEKKALGFDFGQTRVGVNTGPAVVGNFGGEGRFDYTAHGDAINTAARLEGLNKHLGTTICVAGATKALCPDQAFRPIGAIYLKGKEEPVEVFTPLRESERDIAEPYLDAYERLRNQDPEAGMRFDALRVRWPHDPLVTLHAQRLSAGGAGIDIRMTEK